MSLNPETGELTWTPNTTGVFPVELRALNSEGNAIQAFNVTVAPDQPPTAFITKPEDGDTVSGTTAEFFGGSIDDLGTYKAGSRSMASGLHRRKPEAYIIWAAPRPLRYDRTK
jgi:hypothetical protein